VSLCLSVSICLSVFLSLSVIITGYLWFQQMYRECRYSTVRRTVQAVCVLSGTVRTPEKYCTESSNFYLYHGKILYRGRHTADLSITLQYTRYRYAAISALAPRMNKPQVQYWSSVK
jgi:hypothetical protein